MRNATIWGLVALVWLSTIDEGGSAPTGLLAWHALLAAVVIGEIVRGGRGTDRRYTVSPGVGLALAVYAGVVSAGMLLAPYRYAAWLYGLEVATAIAVVWLAARAGPELGRRLAFPVLLLATLQGLAALHARVFLEVPRPAGSFLNPNHLAAWSVAALLLTWGARLAGGRPSRAWDAVHAAMSVIVVTCVAVTGSRGALLGLVAGAVLVAALVWQRLPRTVRRAVAIGFAGIAVLVAVGVAWRAGSSDPFRYQRFRIWRADLSIVAAHPLLGSGPGQLRTTAQAFQFPDGHGPLRYDRGFQTTHSDLLRVPCELGIPGLVAALALVLALGRTTVGRLARGELTPEHVGAIGAIGALLAHGLVENLSARSAIVVLAAVMTGILAAAPARSAEPAPPLFRAALVTLVCLTLLVGDLSPYLAWRAMRGLPRGRLTDAQARLLERAARRNPIHPDVWRRRAEHLTGDGAGWDVDGYARAREAADRAFRLDPRSAESWAGLARVDAVACRSIFAGDAATGARADRAYDEAEARDPLQPLWALEHAEAALDCAEPAVAARAARRALELEPESATPRLVLAASVLRLGGPAAAAESRTLVEEAEAKAREWGSWADTSGYARRLLELDPRNLERVKRDIAELRAAGG